MEILGRSPDELSVKERLELAGKWIALELYDPVTLPLRLIAALGESSADCARQIASRGLDPTRFEYLPLKPPF
ncbi:MAG TPA: hypothetical protein VE621_09625 [Bryobacteraceae bacterium]|nr:hypothetical protein [Bryobacteraceae bacterium]